MHDCPTCGQPTPAGNYCVRCGAPQDLRLGRSRQRRQFAAAPRERRNAPWLVSTLFPQLPRHSERHFHIALAGGAALVIALGVLRLFAIALIGAALLMPLLTALYFYDVDIYEGEPRWASAWTLAWGTLAGVLVGMLANALAPSGSALIDKASTAHLVVGGVLLPLLGVGAALAGPIVLLRDGRFNETLDGASFGAVTAAAFAAAQAVVVGGGVLGSGLRAAGSAAPWVARLVTIAIASPVLSMTAVGSAGAALWLRYRAPVSDRRALGLLGVPAIAVGLAGALVVAGAVAETFTAAGTWLAWLIVLDLLGLVLLRRAVHVGLLEEASEADVGPPVRCANCGATGPSHTFCANCGVALKALPKVRRGGSPGLPAPARGSFAGRLEAELRGRRSGRRRLIAYGSSLAAVVAVGGAVAALAAPPPRRPRCARARQCGRPPIEPRPASAFTGYQSWHSPALGYSLRFTAADWTIASDTSTEVVLQARDGLGLLTVDAARGAAITPAALIGRQRSSLQGQLLGLVLDTNQADQLLGAGVGLAAGPGSVYTATIASPQGPEAPVSVAIMAAGEGNLTISAVVVAPAENLDQKGTVFARADDVINSIRWPGR